MGCLFKEVQEFQDRLVIKYFTISRNKLSATKCSRTNSTSSFRVRGLRRYAIFLLAFFASVFAKTQLQYLCIVRKLAVTNV